MATGLDILYSKIMFRMDTDKRLSSYRKLSSLLRNDFTLTESLDRLFDIESREGKKPSEPFALAFRDWQSKLERGYTFSEAVSGWVPDTEILMLSAADISKLWIALENTVRVVEGGRKIKSALLGALSYPLFLLAATFAIVVMVGVYLLPPMIEAAGKDVVWRGTARTLVDVSQFFGDNWIFMAGAAALAVVLIALSMPWLKGGVRAALDNIAPWSLYKISASAGWLVSLASLIRAGANLPEALKMMSDNSGRYLAEVSDRALENVIAGQNLGDALDSAGLHFPNDEIIGDLKIYADMDEFDKNLMGVANEYMDNSVKRIEAVAGVLNSVGILLISIVIAWVVFGTFEMQDQVAAAIS
ncbi:MAG: type II secretion system F family protein [Rickettsiales bacterium]|jgi:type II secretory pathway component PulF|nr:type II secretion system F family protein [Rickettsiales bacterium]